MYPYSSSESVDSPHWLHSSSVSVSSVSSEELQGVSCFGKAGRVWHTGRHFPFTTSQPYPRVRDPLAGHNGAGKMWGNSFPWSQFCLYIHHEKALYVWGFDITHWIANSHSHWQCVCSLFRDCSERISRSVKMMESTCLKNKVLASDRLTSCRCIVSCGCNFEWLMYFIQQE